MTNLTTNVNNIKKRIMTEQEVCIGSLGQQKVYLHWSDVKDICTNAVAEAYEQASEENKRLKYDVGNLGYKIKNQRHEIDDRLKEIEKLKELLKEWLLFTEEENPKDFTVMSERMQELAQQTNKLLGKNK